MRSAKKINSNRFLDSERIVAKAHFEAINGQKYSSEDLRNLNQKKVFLFVSIFSDDFRCPELDAMLSALCEKKADVVVVVVDGIQGINLVDLDYGKLSHEEIKQQVFNKGIVVANEWIGNNFHVLSKYRNQNSSMRFLLCLNLMKNITQFPECKKIINELLIAQTPKAKQLQDSIKTTVEMHLKNKNNVGNWSRSQKYIEMELAYYMALARDGDFIAYTNKEAPAFKFVRELVKDYKQSLGNVDPAGYIEFSLDRKNPDDLPQTSIEKIKLTGGVSGEYPNETFKVVGQIPNRTASCPIPEVIPHEFQRRRSCSDGNKDVSETPPSISQYGFFTQQKEAKVAEQFSSIDGIMMALSQGEYHEALQKLLMCNNTVSSAVKTNWISKIQELIKVRGELIEADLLKEMSPYSQSDQKPPVDFKGPGKS